MKRRTKRREGTEAIALVWFLASTLVILCQAIGEEDFFDSYYSRVIAELEPLRDFAPEFFAGRKEITKVLPNEEYADVLFLAAEYCENDVKKIEKQFPLLYGIFVPCIIEDLDNDGEVEIVIDCSGYQGDDITLFAVFEKYGSRIEQFDQEVDVGRFTISLEKSKGQKKIALTRRDAEEVGVDKENCVLRKLYTETICYIFTGKQIKQISPLKTVYDPGPAKVQDRP